QCLQQHVATPFTRAAAREQGWNHYRAWLQKQVDEPMFGSPYRLRSLYIPLRGAFQKTDILSSDQEDSLSQWAIVDLQTSLLQWIQEASAQDAVRLLVGEPGSGKSIVLKMLAATVAKEGTIPLLLIPLHLFGPQIDLVQAVKEFVAADPCCHEQTPLDEMAEQERLLLLLDGLEELAMPRQSIVERSRLWLEEILRTSARLNQRTTRLQIIITGREPLCSVHRDLFERPGQFLTLLSYSPQQTQFAEDGLSALANSDQRVAWWEKYRRLRSHSAVASPLPPEDVVWTELTGNPLANHLLALAAEQGRIDRQHAEHCNLFYREMLNSIYQRRYAGGGHSLLLGWDERRFLELLEEMAITIWHGHNDTATLSELQQACRSLPAGRYPQGLVDNPGEALWRLLSAFSFCRAPMQADGEERYTFTQTGMLHYLLARRLLRFLQQMHSQRKIRQNNTEKGWDESCALRNWLRLCGPAAMSVPLIQMLHREIALYPRRTVWEWQKQLAQLLGYLLRQGFPWLDWQYSHYRLLEERCQQAESGLLAVLNGCARHTKKRSPRWTDEDGSFGRWLNRLRPQRTRQNHDVGVLAWLSYLDLRGVSLRLADLYAADLRRSDLRGADLWGANLGYARLDEADLRGALLLHANLQGANLHQVQVGAHSNPVTIIAENS
uniref:pentapeptide repeat-containing protein n=1 Tax=Candidatus Magnetaquicoccus inordinatus TaxID=2496818 RepID=UPI001D0DC074